MVKISITDETGRAISRTMDNIDMQSVAAIIDLILPGASKSAARPAPAAAMPSAGKSAAAAKPAAAKQPAAKKKALPSGDSATAAVTGGKNKTEKPDPKKMVVHYEIMKTKF